MSSDKTLKDFPLMLNNEQDLTTIYFVSPASDEEIKDGNYITVNGMKISSNPRKHAMIKNIKMKKTS